MDNMNNINWTDVTVGRLSKDIEIVQLEIEVLAEALGITDLVERARKKKVMKEEDALTRQRDLELEAKKKANELGITLHDYLMGEVTTGNMAALATTYNERGRNDGN